MKMQKSTMILSGVLGVISVGSVLMFANPGMQEALVSNIFRSRMYSVPAKPVTPATINKNPWGVTPSKPSISGEVIVTNKGKYEGFMNGRLFISTASITKEEAYSNCKQNSANNMNSNIRCTWNGVEILAVTPYTPPKPSISGEVILRPTTPTKPVDVLASITITVDGKNQPDIYNTYKLNEKEAVSYCANLASKVLTTSKFSCIWNGKELGKGFGTKVVVVTKPTVPVTPLATLIMNSDYWGMQTQANMSEGSAKEVCESTWKKYETNSRYTSLVCTWNGRTVFSKTKFSSTSTGSTSTGTVVIPKTPVSTGSTASGVITPAKPVDVLASITVTVDGKNQPDTYNTYKLNEMEAMNYCANLASKVLTTSKFSCIWNGKELGKGFGTKIVTTTSTGSGYYPTTGTGTLPKTPVSTGSTASGVTNTGVISTGSALGVLRVLKDGYNFGTTSTYLYTGTKDGALTFCTGMLSNIGITNQVECLWNDISIFKGFGTMSRLEVYINNKRSTLLDNITKQAATEYCETIKTTTPSTQTLICRWNDITIYTGNGKQVVTQTNSGSTSSGSTSTGSLK